MQKNGIGISGIVGIDGIYSGSFPSWTFAINQSLGTKSGNVPLVAVLSDINKVLALAINS